MPKRVIIIHGTEGSPTEGWFPWLRSKVKSLGAEAVSPALPTPEGQSLESWKREFNRQIGDLGLNDILVGHSIGASFALRLVGGVSQPITGLFTAAGVTQRIGHQKYDPLLASFVDEPFEWATIKQHARTFHAYHGEKDNLVPLAQGREIADGLGVKLQVIKDEGHFSGDDGFTEFPQLWTDLAPTLDPDA